MSVTLPGGLRIDATPEQLRDPEVQKLLAEVMSTLDENPLQKFHPHAKQRPFLEAKVQRKVYVGGVRSGKSTAGVLYDLIQLVDEDLVPERLKPYKIWTPPITVRIITPDFGAQFHAVIATIKKWVPMSQLRSGSWEKAWREKDRQLYFANGSMIDFMSLVQDVSHFGGVTRNIIHYDEEPEGETGREIRSQGLGRLMEVNGQELFTFSPIHGLGWTFEAFEEKKGPEVSKEVWLDDRMILVKSSVWDNPHLDKEGVRQNLEEMPEIERAAYESGNYTHFKGLVYDMFDASIHVVPEEKVTPARIQPLLQVDAIDPGQQTTAIIFGGFDQEGRLLIYDELFLSGVGAIPENAAERYFDMRDKWALPHEPKYRVIDPSAWTRELATGKRIDMAWREAGLKVIPGQNEVEAGVFEVMRRLEHKDAQGNPEPLLRISSRCTSLLKEIGKYRKEPKADGSFGVRKEFDHGLDAMRYLAMTHQIAKQRRKNRRQPSEKRWIPGTAPEFNPPPKKAHGIVGKFS